jgi:MoaA/NifB/PqqE/SkfB family radical SAM enzyme
MRTEQLQRYLEYMRTALRYMSPRKLANLLRIEYRLHTNAADLHGCYPYFLFVDISNRCNLRCPLCPTGQGKTIRRENRMDTDTYIRLLSPVKDYLFKVFLFNWGEPFLNPHIYELISYNTAHNIATTVSSNLNLPVDATRLVQSGLRHLIVSGDGITQDVYAQYRKGGSIDRVLHNLETIVAAKRALGSSTPRIEWQCLVTRYTEEHLSTIRKTVRAAGANTVRFASLNFYGLDDAPRLKQHWLPKNPRYRSLAASSRRPSRTRARRKPCFWLWRTAVIAADGSVLPCCLYDIGGWGNALDAPLDHIWHGTTYTEARSRSCVGHRPSMDLICDRCEAPFIWDLR